MVGQIAVQDLFALLRCEKENGLLFWRPRADEWFSDGVQSARHNANIWNGRFAGKPALNTPMTIGYRMGRIFRVEVYAHRAILAMHHGKWPEGEVDHINGDRADNRVENLRCVTKLENAKNRAQKSNNTTGVTGVDKQGNRFRVRVRQEVIGYCGDIETAAAMARDAFLARGYHENYGRIV